MKVLFDTNVVLDVLLTREPHADVAPWLLSLVDIGKTEGLISATTVTTIRYIATKSVGRKLAHKHMRDLLAVFDVACVDRSVLKSALDLNFDDFEDAVLHESGPSGRRNGDRDSQRERLLSGDPPDLRPPRAIGRRHRIFGVKN